MLVVDRLNNRVVRINDMTGAGWIAFGSFGSGINQFNDPTNARVDTAGKIYVADRANNRVVRIHDMTGAGWTTFGNFGSGINQFNGPTGMFVR